MKIMQNQVAEFTFRSAISHTDPFNSIKMKATFTSPDAAAIAVPAFWAGGDRWRVRYSSALKGVHTFVTECSDPTDTGLHNQKGEVQIVEYVGENALYRRGSVCRRGNDLYLSYRDGTPFYWLGDTWWMGLTKRLRFPGEFAELTDDRVKKGFNVVQVVAGLYPDMLPFDERGANEAGFPWDLEFTSVNPEYFDMADRRIAYLCERGITPCIVGCWGFFMKFAGKDVILRHWDNLIARWGAYPVCWCVAGEANMRYYLDTEGSAEAARAQSRKDWNDVTKHVRESDPFHRLVTIHPTRYGHEQIEDDSLLDLDMLQTGHSGYMTLAPSMQIEKDALDRKKLPVIIGEACYEGIVGSSYADVQRYLYISSFMLGACGHTYGANGIWQVNAREKPYGLSPHGTQWGETPWQEAYRLPGSRHIGDCMKFLTQFEWHRFTCRPDWIDRPCTLSATDGCFAAGIPSEVRVVFLPVFGGPFWGEVQILNLEEYITYKALRFNPITNKTTELGIAMPGADGSWTAPRVDMFGDWIYALVAVSSLGR